MNINDLHSHNSSPKSALEECYSRVNAALSRVVSDYEDLGVLSFRKRAYLRGVMMALSLILRMFQEIDVRWDNSNGDFN